MSEPKSVPAASITPWDIPTARSLYNIDRWGAGYFDVNEAGNVVVTPLRGLTSIADHMVIASGRSSRQVAAMAQHIASKLKESGMKRVAIDVGTSTDGSMPDSAAAGADCPFCLLHATAGLPGSVAASGLLVPQQAKSAPPLAKDTWRQPPGPTWTRASPRAPPVHG